MHCCGDQSLADPVFLEIGADGERPEKAYAPPFCRKIGAHQPAIDRGAECGDMRCPPATINKVTIAPERLGFGYAEKRTKRQAQDALSLRQVALTEGSYHRRALWGIVAHIIHNGRHLCLPDPI